METTTPREGLTLHRLSDLTCSYGGHDSTALEEWDCESIPSYVKEAWYWYSYGCYEGSGYMLCQIQHDGTEPLWMLHCMSHCSCYGPCEERWETGGHATLEALQATCSEELLDRESVRHLITAAREAGHC